MKFLRRKSQRDEPEAELVSKPPSVTSTRDPSPNPVAKDLPPPPLYARFARVTATPSFESLNNSLDAPSASRFSAFNGSTASGFDAAAASPSVRSWSTDGAASQGRAAGSAFLSGGNASNSPTAASSTPKPEPIKLKQRGRRVATESSTPRVISMIDTSAKRAGSPAKPARAYTNGSVEPVRPSYEDRFADKEDITAKLPPNTLGPRASAPVSAGHNASSPLSNADTASAGTPASKRSSTVPNSRSSMQPPKPTLAEDDSSDLYSFYNAAIRMTDSPAPPSPVRTKEGPPIALQNRQATQIKSDENEILVKPPSRRESLPQVPKATTTSAPTEPMRSRTPVQRSSSPVKSSGMAGVGAAGRNSLSSARAPSPAPTPAPENNTNGRYTASPTTLTPVPSSEKISFPKETVIPQYSHSIPEKIPLVKPQKQFTNTAASAAPSSTNTTPKVSAIPIPSSSASSVSTVRQSRIQAKISPPAAAPAPVKADIRPPASQIPTTPSRRSEATPPVSAERTTTPTPSRQSSSASASSAPSATFSRSTATSPSGKSGLNTPDDNMPLTRTPEPQSPERIVTGRSKLEHEYGVSKITLTKKGTVINGVPYGADADITPPATATMSPRPQRVSNSTPGPAAAILQQKEHTEPAQKREVRERPSHNGNGSGHAYGHGYGQEEHAPEPVHRQNGHRHDAGYSRTPIAAAHDVEHTRGRTSPTAHRSRHAPTPEPEPEFDPDLVYPIEEHLAQPELLATMLYFMQFPEILALSSVSKVIRNMLEDRRELREEILERFLGTVGYVRWDFGKKREPLILTLRDLNSYLRGVSIPIHRYAEIAEGQTFSGKESGKSRIVRLLASSTRAYSKVVLRLRAQAEMEAIMGQTADAPANPQSRPTSPLVRAQSPSPATGTWQKTFHSPLYRIGHAPLLRVFVPSPDGAWLSDISVLACEKELKRAGIVPLLKTGDVVWDTAVSDEAGFGNVGRLIWDGNYLIDLDYTFSTTGDIPPYLHSLSFPPAYFHKVLRSSGNPVMQLDLRPWGREIASNLQLVQDRAQAETPQGGRHTVMRWTHRTRFQVIRNTPIPDTNMLVDAGWEGFIVVEAEGTNEGLADLQLRCGMEWFKPQPGVQPKQGDGGRVFRLMRERSRPGEIWMRTVRMKERIS